jgi:hypothetical protein
VGRGGRQPHTDTFKFACMNVDQLTAKELDGTVEEFLKGACEREIEKVRLASEKAVEEFQLHARAQMTQLSEALGESEW